jgi:hypothetical protein
MRQVGLKIAQAQTVDHDDRAAMSAALDRLYGAATQSVQEIVANLSASERARLAVFCYGRAHLNPIGLAMAATCELDHLIAATHSTTAGRTIFAQSRERMVATDRPPSGRRTPISLAASGSRRRLDVQAEPAELQVP